MLCVKSHFPRWKTSSQSIGAVCCTDARPSWFSLLLKRTWLTSLRVSGRTCWWGGSARRNAASRWGQGGRTALTQLKVSYRVCACVCLMAMHIPLLTAFTPNMLYSPVFYGYIFIALLLCIALNDEEWCDVVGKAIGYRVILLLVMIYVMIMCCANRGNIRTVG